MKHRIEIKEPFQIIGRTKRMSEAEEFWHDIGGMWHEWNSNNMTAKVEKKYSSDLPGNHFDISLPTPTSEDSEAFTYTIGCKYNGVPNDDGYDIVTVPGGRYAIFDVPDEYKDDIGEYMGKIIEYLPSAGYERMGVDVEYFMSDKCEAWELIKD